MWTYQFVMMQNCAEKHGWAKFISMQNHCSLLYREEEREMKTTLALETPANAIAAPECANAVVFRLIILARSLCPVLSTELAFREGIKDES